MSRAETSSDHQTGFREADTHIVSKASFIHPPAPWVKECEEDPKDFFVHCIIKTV
jgi:hypothetical protein